MTKVSSELQERMDQRKKKNESLEERQMKRYFRSLKRKARREVQNVVPGTENGLPSKGLNEVRSKKAGQSQSGGTKPRQSSEDQSRDQSSGGVSRGEDDQEKLWVEKMNKLNTERSREEGVKCDGMKEDSVEFSPIVYWKEPLPELLPLDLEGPSKPAQGEVKSQQPTLVKVNLKETSSTSKASLTASQDKKVEQMKWRSEVESVWLDKHRVEEAEAKYYGQKGGEQKKIVAQKKVASAPVTEVLKNVEVTKKAEKTENDDCEDDLTYEDHLEIIKSDNLEMKESLRTLTDVVLKLQERIKNLEDSNCNQLSPLPQSSSQDEGVDMGYNFSPEVTAGEGSLSSTTGSSLHSGSELEEFLPTKGRHNPGPRSVVWKEEWEDDLSSTDLSTVLAQQRRNK